MKDTRNLQSRLQEYTNCFAETNPYQELQEIHSKGIAGEKTTDLTELALKYLSLAILTSVEEESEKIFFDRKGEQNGACSLLGQTQTRLPTPPTGVTQEIISILRSVTDLEPNNAYGKLICGIRSDQLEMDVGVSRVGDRETLCLTVLKE